MSKQSEAAGGGGYNGYTTVGKQYGLGLGLGLGFDSSQAALNAALRAATR